MDTLPAELRFYILSLIPGEELARLKVLSKSFARFLDENIARIPFQKGLVRLTWDETNVFSIVRKDKILFSGSLEQAVDYCRLGAFEDRFLVPLPRDPEFNVFFEWLFGKVDVENLCIMNDVPKDEKPAIKRFIPKIYHRIMEVSIGSKAFVNGVHLELFDYLTRPLKYPMNLVILGDLPLIDAYERGDRKALILERSMTNIFSKVQLIWHDVPTGIRAIAEIVNYPLYRDFKYEYVFPRDPISSITRSIVYRGSKIDTMANMNGLVEFCEILQAMNWENLLFDDMEVEVAMRKMARSELWIKIDIERQRDKTILRFCK